MLRQPSAFVKVTTPLLFSISSSKQMCRPWRHNYRKDPRGPMRSLKTHHSRERHPRHHHLHYQPKKDLIYSLLCCLTPFILFTWNKRILSLEELKSEHVSEANVGKSFQVFRSGVVVKPVTVSWNASLPSLHVFNNNSWMPSVDELMINDLFGTNRRKLKAVTVINGETIMTNTESQRAESDLRDIFHVRLWNGFLNTSSFQNPNRVAWRRLTSCVKGFTTEATIISLNLNDKSSK